MSSTEDEKSTKSAGDTARPKKHYWLQAFGNANQINGDVGFPSTGFSFTRERAMIGNSSQLNGSVRCLPPGYFHTRGMATIEKSNDSQPAAVARQTVSARGSCSAQSMEETGSDKEDGSATESLFVYQPLSLVSKTIRIMKLLPGRPADLLECELEDSPINSAGPYEAISYVWGEKEDVMSIRCQGKKLKIPRNLYDVLRELRCQSKSQKFWADAICIDQQNTLEKSEQVPLMRAIFSRAQNVLIWLGRHEAELAERVFEFAQQVSDKNRKHLVQDKHIWKAFSVMLMQPWFWRIWCFQEVVLAQKAKVMWGKTTIDWEHLGSTAAWINKTGYEVIQNFPLAGVFNATLMFAMSQGTGIGRKSFLRLLMRTRQFKCTEDVDRIYALLGIKTLETDPDQDVLYMKSDYEKSKKAVYEEFATKVISDSQDMTLLSAVQHGPSLDRSIKSWVPQWDKHYTRSIASADFPEITFSAARHLPTSPPSIRGPELVVHGLEVDTVDRMSETMPDRSAFASEHWRIQSLWNAMTEPLRSYPRGSNLSTAFCWTLTAGKDWIGNSIQDEESHIADFAAFVQQNFDAEIRQSLEISDILTHGSNVIKGDAGRYTEAIYCCLCLRRFFVTKKGYIGIGPACMQERDKVCVLSGAIVPFILRSDGAEHKLIGEAYVHGIMHGEACETFESGSEELHSFRLS